MHEPVSDEKLADDSWTFNRPTKAPLSPLRPTRIELFCCCCRLTGTRRRCHYYTACHLYRQHQYNIRHRAIQWSVFVRTHGL